MGRTRAADLLALGAEAVLVAAAAVVGSALNARGVKLYVDAPPLYAMWYPHRGWGTPAALAVAAVVVWWGPRWAAALPWWRLLAGAYVAALAWTMSLAFVDGWSGGLATRLTPQAEYLTEVPRVTDVGALLAGFADGIVDRPGAWSTHTAGHPPGALLVFVGLDRVGLSGGGPAALLCVVVGATVAVSVPLALRSLGDERAARSALPFLVLFPGAVWIGASADGVFAGVVAAGLALLAARWRGAGLAAGLVLGCALFLSYGFVLVGILALAVIALRRHRLEVALSAAAGVVAVVAAFAAAGFWWPDGYRLVVERYYQGWAAERPYSYWVWANLAALVLAAGPVLVPAMRRALVAVRRNRGPAVVLPLAAAAAVLAADLSGLSKAEVERIWLPFAVWLLVAARGFSRPWLAAQAATALAVNHLLWTNW